MESTSNRQEVIDMEKQSLLHRSDIHDNTFQMITQEKSNEDEDCPSSPSIVTLHLPFMTEKDN